MIEPAPVLPHRGGIFAWGGELSVALEIPKDEVKDYIRSRIKAAEAAE